MQKSLHKILLGTGLGMLLVVGTSPVACGAPAATVGPTSPAAGDPDLSPAALFNLGNTEARAGHTGRAVLDYERARVFAPNDPDIRANLGSVRAAAGLPAESGSWFERHARIADPDVLYWLGIIGVLAGGAGSLSIRARVRWRGFAVLALAVGIPLCCVALIDALATWPVMCEAVVMHTTAARVSPVDGSDMLFALPEGQLVRIIDRYGRFALVDTGKGSPGWVAKADLEGVIRPA